MMMKRHRLAAALCAALISASFPTGTIALEDGLTKQVTVLGRDWIVGPAEEDPGLHKATRLNAEMLPFRPPAVLTARQALRAFRSATGCSANLDTFYRSINGSYYAVLICSQN